MKRPIAGSYGENFLQGMNINLDAKIDNLPLLKDSKNIIHVYASAQILDIKITELDKCYMSCVRSLTIINDH